MPVGLLTLELHIADAQSLKDKRQILRSLKDRLRGKFNVAVAELEYHDTWQRSVVGIVTFPTKSIMWKNRCSRFWPRPTVFLARL